MTKSLLLFLLFLFIVAGSAVAISRIPLCQTEDSTNCYWDANKQGNGEGKSFLTIADTFTFYTPNF